MSRTSSGLGTIPLALAGILVLVAGGRAPGAGYTGPYGWLMFYHASVSQSPTYWNGPTQGWGWLSAYGGANDANTMDRWRQITWDQDVTLDGVRVQAFHQRTGGAIGGYNIQYSVDGSTGWTDVPTATTFTGTGAFNAAFTTPVTVRALRVLFPAGSYNMGTGGYGGPGVYQLMPRGSVPGGIDWTDPQFNLLSASAMPGLSVAVSAPGRAMNEGPIGELVDSYLDTDSNRAGWYPPMTGNEIIQVDLGANGGNPWRIRDVELYGGVYYHYLPSSMDVVTSLDGTNWTSVLGTMTSSAGVLRLNTDVAARYIRLQNPPLGSSYILPQEVAVTAFPLPEPGSLALGVLTAAGVLGGRRRRA